MRFDSSVHRAIARAERILAGGRVSDPRESDPGWQAMLDLQDRFVRSNPDEVWSFVLRWGKHSRKNLRAAVGCCLLEHLLEHHFEILFPRVQAAVRKSRRFRDTLRQCYWMGDAARPRNARALDRLAGVKRPRLRRATKLPS